MLAKGCAELINLYYLVIKSEHLNYHSCQSLFFYEEVNFNLKNYPAIFGINLYSATVRTFGNAFASKLSSQKALFLIIKVCK